MRGPAGRPSTSHPCPRRSQEKPADYSLAMVWHLPWALVVLLYLVTAAPTCKGATPSTTAQVRKLLQSTADPGGQCGAAVNARCPSGQCCSQYGYCGVDSDHCDASCQREWSASDSVCASSGNPPPAGGGGGPPAEGSLYSGTASATYYYDLKTSCNGETYPENNGYPYCTSTDPAQYKTLAQYGTNNVVAIDATVLSANKAGLCGKLIRVSRSDGTEVSAPDGGNFFVWDGCQACIGGERVDFSVSGARNIDPNACALGVIPGIRFEVLDTQVQPFVP